MARVDCVVHKWGYTKTIPFAKDPVPTSWPVNFSDDIITSQEELLKLLDKLEQR